LEVPEIYTIADDYALVMNFIKGKNDPTVYRNLDGINIVSSSSNKIQQIDIYDTKGQRLYESAMINSNLQVVKETFKEKILIVKIRTNQNVKSIKLLNQSKKQYEK
jgi:hypothetical protein